MSIISKVKNHDKLHSEVQSMVQAWLDAVMTHDYNNIIKMYHENSVLISTLWNQPLLLEKDRIEYFKMFTSLNRLEGKIEQLETRIYDANIGANYGIYRFTFYENGNKMFVYARFSYTYMLIDGKWVIMSHHSSRMPRN